MVEAANNASQTQAPKQSTQAGTATDESKDQKVGCQPGNDL
jgi:hypothetical protein